MGRAYHHEIGKRHTSNLAGSKKNVVKHGGGSDKEDRGDESAEPEQHPSMEIAPGEPVPPGFEGEIEKLAHIQVSLINEFKAH